MKNGENYNKSKRNFLKTIGTSILILPFLQFCGDKILGLIIKLSGTNHILGHRLRFQDFPKPVKEINIDYLIIGGGIAGLSAGRQLSKKGIFDFLIIELEKDLGGNSSNGENQYSKFPLGAHYLPLPNFEDKELLKFLEEVKIITGYENNGFPVFDEQQLTFAPDERLFYKNSWQEGLIPKSGNSDLENNEFDVFFSKMNDYRLAKGLDNKFLFDIPVSKVSDDLENKKLDSITMKKWLDINHFSTKPLHDYVDYCCKDDFGLGADYVSAWAGIHYFAARKQNLKHNNDCVLTWPEGNARLANHLQKYSENKNIKNHLVYNVKIENNKAIATIFDNSKNTSTKIVAKKIIMATPQFVNQYIIENRKEFTKKFHYAPWLLATLVLNDLNDNDSFPLSWDNVIYGSKGLGYVYDQHQSLEQIIPKKVITYYYSFSSSDLKKTRKEISQKK